ncbi:MlaD family protein [Hypericibacter sp.]|uniref:MlaD family protein n=1 Tax=Hypericibacter sp. TaxID=2705401 RepID=UPI003D6C953F
MAKKSNPKLIGAFVLGAIVLALAGAVAFGGTKFLEHKQNAVLYFEGSMGGLAVGAPVDFRGVQIGTVTSININYNIDEQTLKIPVVIQIFPNMLHVVAGKRDVNNLKVLVERGLRAQLVVQSLVTGQASVEFDFHPETPVRLVGGVTGLPELPTIPSSMDEMQANISAVLEKLSKMPLDQISSQVSGAILNLQQMLTDASTMIKGVNEQITPTLADLQGTAQQAHDLMLAANDRIQMKEGEPLYTLNDTLSDYGKLADQLQGKTAILTNDLQTTLKTLNAALASVDDVTTLLERDLAKNPALLSQTTDTLREFKAMAQSIRALADYLQRNPNALITGKQ